MPKSHVRSAEELEQTATYRVNTCGGRKSRLPANRLKSGNANQHSQKLVKNTTHCYFRICQGWTMLRMSENLFRRSVMFNGWQRTTKVASLQVARS